MKVAGIDGRVFTPVALRDAIKPGRKSIESIRLLVVNPGDYKTCTIDDHYGARYPHLVRETGAPDLLTRRSYVRVRRTSSRQGARPALTEWSFRESRRPALSEPRRTRFCKVPE